MAFAGVASGLHLAALRPTALPSSLTARHRRCGTGMRALEPLMATTTKASLTVVASKQSRYLRDAAQATEALVLATYYAGQPDQIWTPPILPNELSGAPSSPEEVLAMLEQALELVLRADATLGPPATGKEPPEVLAAMSEGISQAAVTIDALQGLQKILGSEAPPAELATLDISHLYGSHTVGALP